MHSIFVRNVEVLLRPLLLSLPLLQSFRNFIKRTRIALIQLTCPHYVSHHCYYNIWINQDLWFYSVTILYYRLWSPSFNCYQHDNICLCNAGLLCATRYISHFKMENFKKAMVVFCGLLQSPDSDIVDLDGGIFSGSLPCWVPTGTSIPEITEGLVLILNFGKNKRV